MFRKIFIDTFLNSEQELKANPPSEKFDLKIVVLLVWTALGLSIIRYYGDPFFVANVLHELGADRWSHDLHDWVSIDTNAELHHLCWWVGTMLFSYLLVPSLLIKLLFREQLSSYGFHLKGAFKDWWLYVLMLCVMLPLVYYFSSTVSFQKRYPFYTPEKGVLLWPKFWIWEAVYFANFIGLEFFFRGVLVHGLKHRFGFYSVFIMTIPYCMIHFGKPMPETIGAIFAGIILGTLSIKSRSVFLGVLIHYSIAIAMDLFSLWRKGYF